MDIAKLRKKAAQKTTAVATDSKPDAGVSASTYIEKPVIGALLNQWDEDEFATPEDATAALDHNEDFLPSASLLTEIKNSSDLNLFDASTDGYTDDYNDESLLGALSRMPSSSDLVEYLHFTAAGEPYAFRIARVMEIIKPRVVSPVPRSPEYIHGILALRGEMIPVVDLMVRLKLRSHARMDLNNISQPRIIILSRGDARIGLYVDNVVGVVLLDESQFEDPGNIQGNRDHRFLKAIGKAGSGFVIVLDMDEFFVEGEM